ncbi:MAG TPA: lipid-A-disaccharide synthase [Desulfobulbaceae bacterium]|nr:lipid-A-disaccharide synthase [Desulfobulbaceae bacterium]
MNSEIMIVTGEASGDLHGANLVRALRDRESGLRFFGMGGPELARAGAELLCDAARLSVVGIQEVFSHLGDILSARRTLFRAMRMRRPALLILIDFPDFNLMLAARARKLGIPVFYYISPQVWAWRSGRMKKIGRLAERIAVILPFEEEFYRERGYAVDFVGHPLLDTVKTSATGEEYRRAQHIAPGSTVVGLLPGSRRKEVVALLPDFLAAAEHLAQNLPAKWVFLVPQAPTVSPQLLLDNGIAAYRDRLDIRVLADNRYDLMAACDAAVAASGTVTLELAILGVPTVAAYRVTTPTYRLGRLLVKLPWFSLVNLIAGREIIPELLQNEVTPNAIADRLGRMLREDNERHEMLQGLAEVKSKLGSPGAAVRAAAIAFSIIRRHER